MSLTKLSLAGNNLFLARESLASDIQAGDGKIVNLFYSVSIFLLLRLYSPKYTEIKVTLYTRIIVSKYSYSCSQLSPPGPDFKCAYKITLNPLPPPQAHGKKICCNFFLKHVAVSSCFQKQKRTQQI